MPARKEKGGRDGRRDRDCDFTTGNHRAEIESTQPKITPFFGGGGEKTRSFSSTAALFLREKGKIQNLSRWRRSCSRTLDHEKPTKNESGPKSRCLLPDEKSMRHPKHDLGKKSSTTTRGAKISIGGESSKSSLAGTFRRRARFPS